MYVYMYMEMGGKRVNVCTGKERGRVFWEGFWRTKLYVVFVFFPKRRRFFFFFSPLSFKSYRGKAQESLHFFSSENHKYPKREKKGNQKKKEKREKVKVKKEKKKKAKARKRTRTMFFEIFGWVFGLLMVIGMLFITVYVVNKDIWRNGIFF